MPRLAFIPPFLGLLVMAGCVQAAPPAATTHLGMANASAAIAIGEAQFLAASDEDNVLRLYATAGAPEPSASFDTTAWLGFAGSKVEEADFEGAARIGDVIYWIGSHGRNKDGKNRPARQRLLATRLSIRDGTVQLEPAGPAYGGLLADFAAAPQLARFGLGKAARLSPEQDGSLNIEGLAATPEGGLLIALRSPLPEGKALLVPLLNPAELGAGTPARLGEAIQLDLGGQGVRDLVWTGREYFLIAGHPTDGGKQQLFRWAGPGQAPEALAHRKLKHFNPEAITALGAVGRPRLLVLSDDGNRKQSKQAAARKFRSFWVEPQ